MENLSLKNNLNQEFKNHIGKSEVSLFNKGTSLDTEPNDSNNDNYQKTKKNIDKENKKNIAGIDTNNVSINISQNYKLLLQII